jgi:hypothetical protein
MASNYRMSVGSEVVSLQKEAMMAQFTVVYPRSSLAVSGFEQLQGL